ncbi:ABC transporter ATP-binding protein [Neobacillus niacini]|nr:ABC transporter ATP-binding protein [Neobacillus niacini]MBY0145895.1 ABC transporter ATP-binding protein [Neobacillus niacini]
MKDTFRKLRVLFDKRDKKKFLLLFIMMIIAAIFETAGIGLIVPFVGIVTNPTMIQEQPILSFAYKLLNFQSVNTFIIFAVGILLTVFILKNGYLLGFYYLQYRVIFNQKVKLSSLMFKGYLTKPYTFHLQRNSAELLRNVNGEVSKIFDGILLATFQLLTETLVVFSILSLLIITAPLATLTAGILLGGSVFIFFKIFRNKITYLGKENQKISREVIKWVNQGLGASKEIKVSGKEHYFVNSYEKQSRIMARNTIYKNMLDQVPRLFIETLLVSVVLITMIIIVFQGTNTANLVATMSLFAMAAFRLMPSINRIVASLSTIRFSQPALTVVYKDLIEDNLGRKPKSENEINESKPVKVAKGEKTFKKSINLEKVYFRYPNQDDYSINDVSLTIPIGNSVAFVGTSGAGKTTIVDIILGLLEPEKGLVFIDGKELNELLPTWKSKIGYIPQSIYLSDETIRKNVAFGIDDNDIDELAVQKAIKDAQLENFVDSLPEGLDTIVGERGVRLSGGQRQRIGIARALYYNPEIIFLDEATSALDNSTEKEIMRAIDGLKGEKTLIIIAHRLSTIENCDIVFKVDKGRLVTVDHKLMRSM